MNFICEEDIEDRPDSVGLGCPACGQITPIWQVFAAASVVHYECAFCEESVVIRDRGTTERAVELGARRVPLADLLLLARIGGQHR